MNPHRQTIAALAGGERERPEHLRRQERAGLSPAANDLLASLPGAQLDALLPHLEPVYLPKGACLCELGRPLTHVYFPVLGIVSLGYAAANGDTTELAIVGRDGVIGVEAFLGSETSSHRASVQTTCTAYRLPVKVARSKFAEGGALQQALLKYALTLMLHVSQTSICNLHHPLEQRLGRSLLQAVDRSTSSTLPMTQEVLASLVGARRQGVSEAVQKLRDRGLIACHRGGITVLDPNGLLNSACECYTVVKAHVQRLAGRT
jgi:CRP-like cAMP-binding protein